MNKVTKDKSWINAIEMLFFCIIVMQGMGAPGNFVSIIPNYISTIWYRINTLASLGLFFIFLFNLKEKESNSFISIALFFSYIIISGIIISDYSSVVIDNCIKLTLNAISTFYIAEKYNKEKTIRLIAFAQIAVTIMILMLFVWGIEYIYVSDGYYSFNLIGLYTTKNSCGYELMFGALVFYYISRNQDNKFKWIVLMIIQLILVFLSRSIGAVLTGIIAVIIPEFHIRKRNYLNLSKIYISYNIAFFAIVEFVLPFFGSILLKLGKNTTLTGRTLIWKAIISFIDGVHTLFGYGYGGFWHNQEHTTALYRVYSQLGVKNGLVGGHNLLIELYLNIGIIGLAFFFCMIICNLGKSILIPAREIKFESLCLFFIIIRGFFERTFNSSTYDMIILFVVMGMIVGCNRLKNNKETILE